VREHGGDFTSYWSTCQGGREGKAFEAVICDTHNRRAVASGAGDRLVPTAAVGYPHDSADLLLLRADGSVLKRVQAKSGVGALIDAIDDERYVGMDLVAPRESYDALRVRLIAEIEHAQRRGINLPERWARVREAVETGRVWRSIPCEAPLPERAAVGEVTQAHYRLVWSRKVSPTVSNTGAAIVESAVPKGVGAPIRAGVAAVAPAIRSSVPRPAPGPGSVADDVATAAAAAGLVVRPMPLPAGSASRIASAADDVIAPALGSVTTVAGPVAIAADGLFRLAEAGAVEEQYARGELSAAERDRAHARNALGFVGSTGGAAAGAYGGAAVGTMICPGIGTFIGGIIGAIGGSVGGGAFGEALVE
jgi:hypothetical protein